MMLQIEAIDTLFFRDGKPFEMGDEVWANGIFPPLPSVFYGAIRTAYFSQYPEKLALANTDDDPTKGLKIKGIYLSKGGTVYIPIPADFASPKKSGGKEILFQRNNLDEKVFSSSKTVLNPYKEEVEKADGFIDIYSNNAFDDFFEDTQNQASGFVKSEKLFSKELKIGIGRQNATRTTEEGKLYRVAMNRMEVAGNPNEKLSFLVDTNIEEVWREDFKPNFLKLGGENKIAQCKIYDIEIEFPKPEIQKFFKLYFLTPTIFKNGWLPNEFEYDQSQNAYIGTWKGVKLKLIRSFVNGSVAVGGFDVKEKQPKTMYKAVPAGTVYHFEISGNSQNLDIHQTFGNPNEPLSDIYPEQGFGLSMVGLLNETPS
ncbi:MAG: type III-B CRISPR module-associated protein Cmr3 [Microscillaceae bacterium]|nr:type III-B CRISPR module-associated protein Cmr3 [Microscillaceae bacterium]